MKNVLFAIVLLNYFNSYCQSNYYSKDSLKYAINKNYREWKVNELSNEYYSKSELEDRYISENDVFQTLSKPDENSDLSIYFKNNLPEKLLKKIDYSVIKSSYRYENISNKVYNYTIRLTFEIDKKNKASNIHIYTGDNDLNKQIIAIFKNYPLEKLSIDESYKTGVISVQLFAKENKQIIIKASTFAVVDRDPVIKNCKDVLQPLYRRHSCLYMSLYNYILANISPETISKQKLRGEINIRPRFSVGTDGKIFHINSIAPNKIIKDEIDRIIESYGQITTPAMKNDTPIDFFYDTTYVLFFDNKK